MKGLTMSFGTWLSGALEAFFGGFVTWLQAFLAALLGG